MEIIFRKIEDLKKLSNNPRTISEEQMDKLKESLMNNQDYFQARPIILSNRTGELVIIAGNQRYDASIQLGFKEVPTVLIEGLTEEREREIVIRDNVNNGEWDLLKIIEGWDCTALLDWGLYIDDSNEEFFKQKGRLALDGDELKNEHYEAVENIGYLKFGGTKIPLSADEESKFQNALDKYMEDNGVIVGFINSILHD